MEAGPMKEVLALYGLDEDALAAVESLDDPMKEIGAQAFADLSQIAKDMDVMTKYVAVLRGQLLEAVEGFMTSREMEERLKDTDHPMTSASLRNKKMRSTSEAGAVGRDSARLQAFEMLRDSLPGWGGTARQRIESAEGLVRELSQSRD